MFFSIIFLACLVAFGECSDLDSQWVDFKTSFSKQYATEEIELGHFEIWKTNLALVENHNKEAGEGVHSYTMAIKGFSDLSDEEFERTMLGYVNNDEASDNEEMEYFQVKDTPAAIDYRQEGLVTPVKFQGGCGSCWAFSGAGGIEGVWARKVGELVSVSEQQLLDCGPGHCSGGNIGSAFGTAQGGMMREEDYPYEHEEKECRFDENLVVFSVTGMKSVAHNEEQLELALSEVGYPISIAMRASATFQNYESGIYDDVDCVEEGGLNHALLIVGYNKKGNTPYWIAKNSWSDTWGLDGYVHLKMGQNICGVANRPVYPVIDW